MILHQAVTKEPVALADIVASTYYTVINRSTRPIKIATAEVVPDVGTQQYVPINPGDYWSVSRDADEAIYVWAAGPAAVAYAVE